MSFTEQSVVYLSKEYRAPASFGAVGASATAGGNFIIDNDDNVNTNSTNAATQSRGTIYQEVFIPDGTTAIFTVTENDGILPETTDDIIITLNGLIVPSDNITALDSNSGQITLGFTPENGDRLVVIWFFRGAPEDQGIYQQVLTPSGSSATFTLTSNAGVIPDRPQEMFVFINGLFLDYNKFTAYNSSLSQFTLDFIPDTLDSLACVWFASLPENIKILQEKFIADGSSATYTVTLNEGKLPKVKDAILLMRNGQHINNDYISGYNPSNGSVTLSFIPDSGDVINIIWFMEEVIASHAKLYQEQFTTNGTDNFLTVTKNNGKLAKDLDSIMIYRNGQFINNGFVSLLEADLGKITFSFTPRVNEKFTIVWVITK